MDRYVVVLERKGKYATVILRADDYIQSIRIDRANNPHMKYGSGPQWNVLNVMDYDAYVNQADSKPFS